MKCKICGKQTEGKRKTCSTKCLNENSSRLASARRKAGVVKGIHIESSKWRNQWNGRYEN